MIYISFVAALEQQEQKNYCKTSLVHLRQILMDIGTAVLCSKHECICVFTCIIYAYNICIFITLKKNYINIYIY